MHPLLNLSAIFWDLLSLFFPSSSPPAIQILCHFPCLALPCLLPDCTPGRHMFGNGTAHAHLEGFQASFTKPLSNCARNFERCTVSQRGLKEDEKDPSLASGPAGVPLAGCVKLQPSLFTFYRRGTQVQARALGFTTLHFPKRITITALS